MNRVIAAHILRPSAAALALLAAGACARRPHTPSAAEPGAAVLRSAAAPRASTQSEVAAQRLFDAGSKHLQRGLTAEALHDFEQVRTEHPYSPLAALAELRAADAHMRRGSYLEAIDGYRGFLRFHPAHAEAPYALGRVGEAYFRQIPRDWWFMPPGAERDQTQVRQAIATYEDLLARYPSDEAAALARTHLDACRAKLAEHELYVARFYFGRQQWAGAVGRAETLLHQYGGLGLDAEALFMLGQARMAQGKIRQGRSALEQLVADHPDSRFARRVPKLLAGEPKAADIE